MVYFHSVDVVLGRTDIVRRAWSFRCHLPKVLFHPQKGRSRSSSSNKKCYDYPLFKRMLLCKSIVFKNHTRMFRLYEKYCDEASLEKYWGGADENSDEETEVKPAESTNEIVDDDGF